MPERFVALLEAGGPAHLAGLGDSLTYGYMVSRGYFDMVADGLRDRYPEAQLTVTNCGVCGDTAAGGLARTGQLFRPGAPDLALVQFGLNDCYMGIPAEEFREDLLDVVYRLGRDAPECEILVVPPPLLRFDDDNRMVKPFRRAFTRAAEEADVRCAPVEDHWCAHEAAGPLWLSDGVHPSEEGYSIIASAVLTAILGGKQ